LELSSSSCQPTEANKCEGPLRTRSNRVSQQCNANRVASAVAIQDCTGPHCDCVSDWRGTDISDDARGYVLAWPARGSRKSIGHQKKDERDTKARTEIEEKKHIKMRRNRASGGLAGDKESALREGS